MGTFYNKTYLYPTPSHGTRAIGVCKVMGALWGVCWISDTNGRKRVRTSRLPVTVNPDDLQPLFDTWAVERKLEEVL